MFVNISIYPGTKTNSTAELHQQNISARPMASDQLPCEMEAQIKDIRGIIPPGQPLISDFIDEQLPTKRRTKSISPYFIQG